MSSKNNILIGIYGFLNSGRHTIINFLVREYGFVFCDEDRVIRALLENQSDVTLDPELKQRIAEEFGLGWWIYSSSTKFKKVICIINNNIEAGIIKKLGGEVWRVARINSNGETIEEINNVLSIKYDKLIWNDSSIINLIGIIQTLIKVLIL